MDGLVFPIVWAGLWSLLPGKVRGSEVLFIL